MTQSKSDTICKDHPKSMHYIAFPLFLVLSYMIGSLNGAHIISKFFYNKNITLIGTTNAGAGNIIRNFGLRAGFAAGTIDFMKGAVPVVAGSAFQFSPSMLLFLGSATIAGHNWPIFFRFRGGRGTATLFGFLSAFLPHVMVNIALVFIPLSFFPISGFFPFFLLGVIDYLHLPQEGFFFIVASITLTAVILIRRLQTEWKDIARSSDKILAIFNMVFVDHVKTDAKNKFQAIFHLFTPRFLKKFKKTEE